MTRLKVERDRIDLRMRGWLEMPEETICDEIDRSTHAGMVEEIYHG